MGKYVHYTQEEKERANRVNLEELLLRSGEELLPSGREKRLGQQSQQLPFAGTAGMITQKKKVDLPSTL